MKKTFRVCFPIVGTGYDRVDVNEKELEGKTELEIKTLLIERSSAGGLCHQCSDVIEDPEYSDSLAGKNLENVSYWEDEES